ncbi:MAG: response regulator [Candidatus Saccharibacteria bacterium]|nr:response regulator [Rhodoferax sp.]
MNAAAPLILVIEDETAIRDNLRRFLMLEGYSVVTAANGVQGLEVMGLHQPDLVLCDVMMPQMNGFEVLEHMRRNVAFVHTPVIFLTASADRESMTHGLELGAQDYVTKPFSLPELTGLIRQRLRA